MSLGDCTRKEQCTPIEPLKDVIMQYAILAKLINLSCKVCLQEVVKYAFFENPFCTKTGAVGPTPWPSGWVCTLCFGGAGFLRFGSCAQTWYHSSSHAEAASCMPQLEGPTTENTQLCSRGIWEKKGKIKSLKKKKQGRWVVTKFRVPTMESWIGCLQPCSLCAESPYSWKGPDSPKPPEIQGRGILKILMRYFNTKLIVIKISSRQVENEKSMLKFLTHPTSHIPHSNSPGLPLLAICILPELNQCKKKMKFKMSEDINKAKPSTSFVF